MAITDKHTFGWEKEYALKVRLENALEEQIIKSKSRYATYDFESESWFIELKCRCKFDKNGNLLLYSTHNTWLLPTCKEALADKGKSVVFFYYFEGDQTLWYLIYDPDLFATFERRVPFFTNQEHFYIPKECWTQLVEDD